MNSIPGTDAVDGIAPADESPVVDPRETTVCVVGLGYVGLPLAVGFDDAGYDVVGHDISQATVDQLSEGVDTTGDLGDETVQSADVSFTTDPARIEDASYVLVTVPTPVDENDHPRMDFVESAAENIGRNMTPGTTVVLESTVYPGATREVLIPALEEAAGLDCGEEFHVGYSPERANPGDEKRGLRDVVKIVSGQNEAVRERVASLYEHVIDAGVHRAPSMEVAEAAKVVENLQRDVNIALVNELAMTFEEIDIDARSVLEAAGTKWNFHEYEPGLVSGHCIPVDPNFLLYRAEQEDATPELVKDSREINESMSDHVADLMVKALTETGRPLSDSRVLAAGLSYKADVADVRNGKVADVLAALREYEVDIAGYDPVASEATLTEHFDVDVLEDLALEGFDALLLSTPHRELRALDPAEVADRLEDPPAIVDVYGTFDPDDVPEEVAYRRV